MKKICALKVKLKLKKSEIRFLNLLKYFISDNVYFKELRKQQSK